MFNSDEFARFLNWPVLSHGSHNNECVCVMCEYAVEHLLHVANDYPLLFVFISFTLPLSLSNVLFLLCVICGNKSLAVFIS